MEQFSNEGRRRRREYTKEFKEPNPYVFILNEIPNNLEEGSSFELTVKVKPAPGFSSLPKQLYIILDQGKFLMKQEKRNSFSFNISSINK